MISDFAVIGLGAIGGSLVRALHADNATVVGFDANATTVADAQRAGFNARLWTTDTRVDADAVIIAVPVQASLAILASLVRHGDYQLITDVGSTKRVVNAAALELGLAARFVGSHPLAGTEQSGWHVADPAMFQGKTVFVCPTPATEAPALQDALALWQRLGAVTQQTAAKEHDERIAWLSHLPQLSATALALALRTGGVQRTELGRGGVDMTRLAASDPHIWRDILATNSDNLDEPLDCLIAALTDLRASLRARKPDRVADLLDAARAWSI